MICMDCEIKVELTLVDMRQKASFTSTDEPDSPREPKPETRSTSKPELDDDMIVRLAKKITTRTKLTNLGVELKVPLDKAQGLSVTVPEFHEAVVQILQDWRSECDDWQDAYMKMKIALPDAGLKGLVKEVLQAKK